MTMRCKVCDWLPDLDIAPGVLRDMRALLGPRMRYTIGGLREVLCFYCQKRVAKFMGLAL